MVPSAARQRLIRLSGELDIQSGRELSAELSQAVGDITREPVVDLRAVSFIDSTALGVLAHAGEQLRNQGRVLTLVVTPGPVTELLEVSGIADRFALVPTPPAHRVDS